MVEQVLMIYGKEVVYILKTDLLWLFSPTFQIQIAFVSDTTLVETEL